MITDIEPLWNAWMAFFAANGFMPQAGLEPGASDHEVAELEQATGLQLSEPIKSLFRLANGQKPVPMPPTPVKLPALFGFYEFLGTTLAADEWRMWKDIQDQEGPSGMADHADFVVVTQPDLVKKEYWIAGWLPFARDGGGNSLAFDFSPESQGTAGQIIVIGSDEDHRRVLAPGIGELLHRMLDSARENKIVIHEIGCDIRFIAGRE